MDNNSLNLFGIYADKIDTDMFDFAEKAAYISWPLVAVAKNEEIPYIERTDRPIELFKSGTLYSSIRGIMRGKNDRVLSIPWTAFREIQDISRQKSNKVLADLVAAIIVRESSACVKSTPESRNLFFVECSDPRKIIGRLGNLYLDQKKIIIVFVTYKAGGLMTDLLTNKKEQLYFDIDYFKNNDRKRSDIIPNDYRESLTQTFFINMTKNKKRMSPIRCEILSQGLNNSEIRRNVEFVDEVLSDSSKLTPPFSVGNNIDSDPFTRIPNVLKNAENKYNAYRDMIRNEV